MSDYHKPLPRDQASTVQDAMKKIRLSPDEHLYLYKNGKQIRRFKGNKNSVVVSNKYLFEIKDAVIVHNHPQGSSFSYEDIVGIIKYDAAECILVTDRYDYKIYRPKNGWNIDVDSKEFEEQVLVCRKIAEEQLNKFVSNNTIDINEKEVEIFHYIWMFFFRELNNIKYVREKPI